MGVDTTNYVVVGAKLSDNAAEKLQDLCDEWYEADRSYDRWDSLHNVTLDQPGIIEISGMGDEGTIAGILLVPAASKYEAVYFEEDLGLVDLQAKAEQVKAWCRETLAIEVTPKLIAWTHYS